MSSFGWTNPKKVAQELENYRRTQWCAENANNYREYRECQTCFGIDSYGLGGYRCTDEAFKLFRKYFKLMASSRPAAQDHKRE